MSHLNELVLDMGCFLSTVEVCGNSCSTDEDITNTNLTSAVRLSVVACETLNEDTSELILTI